MATLKERHPEVFIERHEDPHKRRRTVPMEVLSLGVSRTGTMSMKAALEILGIPTWHWVTMSENPADMAMWAEAFRSKYSDQPTFGREQFDNLLGLWGTPMDQPAHIFAEELITAYPEAKVVLVERDIDRWYQSFCNAVIEGNANPFIPIISLVDKVYIGRMAALQDLVVGKFFGVQEPRLRWGGLFNNPKWFAEWRATAKAVYVEHNEMVKKVTPKERLLLFQLQEGWGPLCEFLGKPVPDVPFPRVNETLATEEMVNAYVFEGYKRWAVRFAKRAVPALAVVVVAMAAWKR